MTEPALELHGIGRSFFGVAALDDVVRRQAEAIAYADNFLFLSLLCVTLLGILALIRKPASRQRRRRSRRWTWMCRSRR
ncbi:MAG: hypothetical protein HC933_17845 [Pleurocapsa sp. SU_196_0]|nr:hypothetical protein [Pleurocapsa sp. SU_196_0]